MSGSSHAGNWCPTCGTWPTTSRSPCRNCSPPPRDPPEYQLDRLAGDLASFLFTCSAVEESCPDRSLRARCRGLVAVGLGRALECIGGGLCCLSRVGGSA